MTDCFLRNAAYQPWVVDAMTSHKRADLSSESLVSSLNWTEEQTFGQDVREQRVEAVIELECLQVLHQVVNNALAGIGEYQVCVLQVPM